VAPTLFVAIALAVLVLALLAFSRATQLFVGKFERGAFKLERGRCPPRLLDELADIARLERLDGVRLSVVSEAGLPRVTAQGAISDGQLQQIRNVVGRFDVARIRRGGRRA